MKFDTAMLTLGRPQENLGDAAGASEVVTVNRGKFKDEMDPQVLARVEEIAGAVLEECGYELALPRRPERRLSPLEMRLAQLRDAWHLARSDHHGWGFWRTALFHLRYFAATRG